MIFIFLKCDHSLYQPEATPSFLSHAVRLPNIVVCVVFGPHAQSHSVAWPTLINSLVSVSGYTCWTELLWTLLFLSRIEQQTLLYVMFVFAQTTALCWIQSTSCSFSWVGKGSSFRRSRLHILFPITRAWDEPITRVPVFVNGSLPNPL